MFWLRPSTKPQAHVFWLGPSTKPQTHMFWLGSSTQGAGAKTHISNPVFICAILTNGEQRCHFNRRALLPSSCLCLQIQCDLNFFILDSRRVLAPGAGARTHLKSRFCAILKSRGSDVRFCDWRAEGLRRWLQPTAARPETLIIITLKNNINGRQRDLKY